MDELNFHKNLLREKNKKKRLLMGKCEKLEKDRLIFKRLTETEAFLKSELILTYISKSFEVDTRNFIDYSLKLGKKIAVPLTIESQTKLEFYLINSFEELKLGKFSIYEPVPSKRSFCDKNQIEKSLCIVPGLAFNLEGYRIGFGKGYYDRFFEKYYCKKVGICYEFNLEDLILKNENDIPVDVIITERRKIVIN